MEERKSSLPADDIKIFLDTVVNTYDKRSKILNRIQTSTHSDTKILNSKLPALLIWQKWNLEKNNPKINIEELIEWHLKNNRQCRRSTKVQYQSNTNAPLTPKRLGPGVKQETFQERLDCVKKLKQFLLQEKIILQKTEDLYKKEIECKKALAKLKNSVSTNSIQSNTVIIDSRRQNDEKNVEQYDNVSKKDEYCEYKIITEEMPSIERIVEFAEASITAIETVEYDQLKTKIESSKEELIKSNNTEITAQLNNALNRLEKDYCVIQNSIQQTFDEIKSTLHNFKANESDNLNTKEQLQKQETFNTIEEIFKNDVATVPRARECIGHTQSLKNFPKRKSYDIDPITTEKLKTYSLRESQSERKLRDAERKLGKIKEILSPRLSHCTGSKEEMLRFPKSPTIVSYMTEFKLPSANNNRNDSDHINHMSTADTGDNILQFGNWLSGRKTEGTNPETIESEQAPNNKKPLSVIDCPCVCPKCICKQFQDNEAESAVTIPYVDEKISNDSAVKHHGVSKEMEEKELINLQPSQVSKSVETLNKIENVNYSPTIIDSCECQEENKTCICEEKCDCPTKKIENIKCDCDVTKQCKCMCETCKCESCLPLDEICKCSVCNCNWCQGPVCINKDHAGQFFGHGDDCQCDQCQNRLTSKLIHTPSCQCTTCRNKRLTGSASFQTQTQAAPSAPLESTTTTTITTTTKDGCAVIPPEQNIVNKYGDIYPCSCDICNCANELMNQGSQFEDCTCKVCKCEPAAEEVLDGIIPMTCIPEQKLLEKSKMTEFTKDVPKNIQLENDGNKELLPGITLRESDRLIKECITEQIGLQYDECVCFQCLCEIKDSISFVRVLPNPDECVCEICKCELSKLEYEKLSVISSEAPKSSLKSFNDLKYLDECICVKCACNFESSVKFFQIVSNDDSCECAICRCEPSKSATYIIVPDAELKLQLKEKIADRIQTIGDVQELAGSKKSLIEAVRQDLISITSKIRKRMQTGEDVIESVKLTSPVITGVDDTVRKCACDTCKCEELISTMKKVCDCTLCNCAECSLKKVVGTDYGICGPSCKCDKCENMPESPIGYGVKLPKPENCSCSSPCPCEVCEPRKDMTKCICIMCKCDGCKKTKSKASTLKSSTIKSFTNSGEPNILVNDSLCKCKMCQCKDCNKLNFVRPKHCTCKVCVCDSCPKNIKPADKKRSCICSDCKCDDDCKSSTKQACSVCQTCVCEYCTSNNKIFKISLGLNNISSSTTNSKCNSKTCNCSKNSSKQISVTQRTGAGGFIKKTPTMEIILNTKQSTSCQCDKPPTAIKYCNEINCGRRNYRQNLSESLSDDEFFSAEDLSGSKDIYFHKYYENKSITDEPTKEQSTTINQKSMDEASSKIQHMSKSELNEKRTNVRSHYFGTGESESLMSNNSNGNKESINSFSGGDKKSDRIDGSADGNRFGDFSYVLKVDQSSISECNNAANDDDYTVCYCDSSTGTLRLRGGKSDKKKQCKTLKSNDIISINEGSDISSNSSSYLYSSVSSSSYINNNFENKETNINEQSEGSVIIVSGPKEILLSNSDCEGSFTNFYYTHSEEINVNKTRESRLLAGGNPSTTDCNCIECLCTQYDSSTNNKLTAKPCTCNVCVCDPCANGRKSPFECTCNPCKCKPCAKQTEMGMDTEKSCSCKVCDCDNCQPTQKDLRVCICKVCDCTICKKLLKKKMVPNKNCTCAVCECKLDSGDAPTDTVTKSTFMEPGDTEQVKTEEDECICISCVCNDNDTVKPRDDCECEKCTCEVYCDCIDGCFCVDECTCTDCDCNNLDFGLIMKKEDVADDECNCPICLCNLIGEDDCVCPICTCNDTTLVVDDGFCKCADCKCCTACVKKDEMEGGDTKRIKCMCKPTCTCDVCLPLEAANEQTKKCKCLVCKCGDSCQFRVISVKPSAVSKTVSHEPDLVDDSGQCICAVCHCKPPEIIPDLTYHDCECSPCDCEPCTHKDLKTCNQYTQSDAFVDDCNCIGDCLCEQKDSVKTNISLKSGKQSTTTTIRTDVCNNCHCIDCCCNPCIPPSLNAKCTCENECQCTECPAKNQTQDTCPCGFYCVCDPCPPNTDSKPKSCNCGICCQCNPCEGPPPSRNQGLPKSTSQYTKKSASNRSSGKLRFKNSNQKQPEQRNAGGGGGINVPNYNAMKIKFQNTNDFDCRIKSVKLIGRGNSIKFLIEDLNAYIEENSPKDNLRGNTLLDNLPDNVAIVDKIISMVSVAEDSSIATDEQDETKSDPDKKNKYSVDKVLTVDKETQFDLDFDYDKQSLSTHLTNSTELKNITYEDLLRNEIKIGKNAMCSTLSFDMNHCNYVVNEYGPVKFNDMRSQTDTNTIESNEAEKISVATNVSQDHNKLYQHDVILDTTSIHFAKDVVDKTTSIETVYGSVQMSKESSQVSIEKEIKSTEFNFTNVTKRLIPKNALKKQSFSKVLSSTTNLGFDGIRFVDTFVKPKEFSSLIYQDECSKILFDLSRKTFTFDLENHLWAIITQLHSDIRDTMVNVNLQLIDECSVINHAIIEKIDSELFSSREVIKKPSVGAGDIGTGLRNDESLEMDSTHAKVSSSTPTHLDSTLSPINDYKIGKYQTSDCFPEPLANCDPTLTDSTMINASDLIGSYQSLQSTAADNNGGFFSEAAFMTATGGLCTGTSEKVGGLGATGFEQTTDATETGYYSSEESDQGGGGGQYEYGAGGASGSDGAGGSDDPPGGSSSDDVESYSGKKGKCDCPEPCVCYGCPDKPITVPVCDCPDTCQCVGCPVGKEHTCNCKTCYCELCADITREKGTTKEVKQLCHCGNDCLCEKCTSERYTKTACDCEGECICAICPLKDKDCECAICLCSDCELMKRKMNKDMCDCAQCLCETCEKGGGIQIPTKQKIPNISCKCPICLCSDCPSAQKKSCACPVCLCEKCPDLEGKKQYECTCYPKCECDLCPDPSIPKKCTASKVSISKPIPEKKPAPKHKDGCRCPTCCCNPCQSKKSETAMCKCADPCKCNPCSNKAIIPKKDGCKCDKCSCPVCEPIPSHPPECKCAVCCCKPCAGKEDPKEKCVCSECLCGMCKFKPKKTASVECKCSKCQCSPCSSGGGKQQTKSATSIKGDCKCSQCFCIKCTKKPQMSHPPDCKCLQCMCTPCLKKSVSAHAECKCAKCTCNPCSLKKKDAKNCSCAVCRCTDCPIAAKAVTSSEGCKCCPCNCTNCPSKPGGGTPKPSYSAKSIKQCKCTDPCKCSPCAGKDSKSKFPFENIKPCTCNKPCTCSTCPGVDNKKTCSCKDPCSCQNCQNKPSVRESKPTVASTTSIPKTCSCPAPCICQPCSKMSSPSQVACVKCDCNDKSKCKPACSGHQKAAAPTSRCSTEKFPFENIKPCTCKDPCSCEACPD